MKMKKILLLTGLISLVVACGGTTDGYTIEGKLRGLVKDSTMVFLKKSDKNNMPVTIDTVVVKDGEFTITAPTPESLEMHYLFVDKAFGNLAFIAENGKIYIETHVDSLQYGSAKGTPQNDLFKKFVDEAKAVSNKARAVDLEYRKAARIKDTAIVNSLKDEMKELRFEAKNHEIDFVTNNPDAFISLLIIDRFFKQRAIPEEESIALFDKLNEDIKATHIGTLLSDFINEKRNRETKKPATQEAASTEKE